MVARRSVGDVEPLRGRAHGEAATTCSIDLLPKEHRAAWTPDDRVAVVSIEFVDPSGKPGGHFAKAAKGELARAILTDGLAAVDRWRHDRFELAIT